MLVRHAVIWQAYSGAFGYIGAGAITVPNRDPAPMMMFTTAIVRIAILRRVGIASLYPQPCFC